MRPAADHAKVLPPCWAAHLAARAAVAVIAEEICAGSVTDAKPCWASVGSRMAAAAAAAVIRAHANCLHQDAALHLILLCLLLLRLSKQRPGSSAPGNGQAAGCCPPCCRRLGAEGRGARDVDRPSRRVRCHKHAHTPTLSLCADIPKGIHRAFPTPPSQLTIGEQEQQHARQ